MPGLSCCRQSMGPAVLAKPNKPPCNSMTNTHISYGGEPVEGTHLPWGCSPAHLRPRSLSAAAALQTAGPAPSCVHYVLLMPQVVAEVGMHVSGQGRCRARPPTGPGHYCCSFRKQAWRLRLYLSSDGSQSSMPGKQSQAGGQLTWSSPWEEDGLGRGWEGPAQRICEACCLGWPSPLWGGEGSQLQRRAQGRGELKS